MKNSIQDISCQVNTRPMNSYQWTIVFMLALMNMLDGYDVLALAFTAHNIKTEFALSSTVLGYLLSTGLVGMALGSLFLAPLADKIGRRTLLLLMVALSLLGMLASAFAFSPIVLGICRQITGLGVGGMLVCGNVLVSEYSSVKWRGVAVSIFISGYSLGAVLGGIFSLFMQQHYGWRSVFLVGALFSCICWITLYFFLPESVSYLVNQRPKGWKEKLKTISQKLRISTYTIPQISKEEKSRVSIVQLFSPQIIRETLMLWTTFFAIMFAFYFVNFWTPTLLKENGMSDEQSITVGLMISIGTVCGAASYGFFAIRWSARSVLAAFMLLSSLVMILFVLSINYLSLAMVVGVNLGFLINGCISGVYMLNTLIYPSNIRSTGVGWAVGIGRIGAIIAPPLAGWLLDLGCQKDNLYLGVALLLLVSCVFLISVHRKTEEKSNV